MNHDMIYQWIFRLKLNVKFIRIIIILVKNFNKKHFIFEWNQWKAIYSMTLSPMQSAKSYIFYHFEPDAINPLIIVS